MKSFKLFYMKGCPYCRTALRVLDELKETQEKYSSVETELIEENEQPEIAGQYDYYHVPTVYVDERKVFETQPGDSEKVIRENLIRALDMALEQ